MQEMQGFSKSSDSSKFSVRGRTTQYKDENAVNHEIASLLLNLASRTQNSASTDRSYVATPTETTEAMDLSNYTKPNVSVSQSSSHKMQTIGMSHSNVANSSINPYSLLSSGSLASMAGINSNTLSNSLSNSISNSLSSSYLLQNLLMQQLASPQLLSTSSSSPTSSKSNVVPSTPTSKPPSISSSSTNTSTPLLSLPSLGGNGVSNIPLLSGQIVAQLNSLLFAVHGIQEKSIEMNVQGQLAAIYTRLQEIVTMVQLSKKKPVADNTLPKVSTKSSSSQEQPKQDPIHQTVKPITSTKEQEEQKIARQLAEYQKALAKTQTSTTSTTQAMFGSHGTSGLTTSVANLLRNQIPVTSEQSKPVPSPTLTKPKEERVITPEKIEVRESISSSSVSVRERKVSEDNCGYIGNHPDSPPEKRSRLSPLAVSPDVGALAISSSGRSGRGGGGKGGKGIRNRVFCGDCQGCLKNDDCGVCRYCRDKTKFGGQNRLRQKCLHRRCQMDNHRRSNGGPLKPGMQSPSPPPTPQHQHQQTNQQTPSTPQDIYSGVELAARLAASGTTGVDPSIFSSILGNVNNMRTQTTVLSKLAEEEGKLGGETEDRGGNNEHSECDRNENDIDDREDSKEREELQQMRRSDKWKAKHEAMLKLATEKPSSNSDRKYAKDQTQNFNDSPRNSHSLVINLNETRKELTDSHIVRKKTEDIFRADNFVHKLKFPERNAQPKSIESSSNDARLPARSMKTVMAV